MHKDVTNQHMIHAYICEHKTKMGEMHKKIQENFSDKSINTDKTKKIRHTYIKPRNG